MVLLLLDKGHSCVGVGGILLLDDDTTRKYRNIYLNQVATSLLTDHNKGRKPFTYCWTIKNFREAYLLGYLYGF